MQTTEDHLRANTNLFVDFTTEDLEVLAPAAKRRSLMAGEVLCQRGDPGSSLYIISVGSIEVHRLDDVPDAPLTTLRRGEACGEIALVCGGSRTADLVAAEDSAVLEISRDDLNEVIADHPEVEAKLWRNLAATLSQRLASTSLLLARSIKINQQLINDEEFREHYSKI